MKPIKKQYWEKVTNSLGKEGASPIPTHLAERVFTQAIQKEQKRTSFFLDIFTPYAWKAALVSSLLVMVLFAFSMTVKVPPQNVKLGNPLQLSWEIREEAFSIKTVASAILVTHHRGNEREARKEPNK